MLYAEVIPDINHHNLDRTFEYSVPEGLQMQPGMRVLVPFGRGDRPTEAFVTAVKSVSAYDARLIKPVIRALDDYCVLDAAQLDLAFWMREKYNCLLVDALKLMIPAQLRTARREKTVRVAALAIDGQRLELALRSLVTAQGKVKAPLQRSVLEALQQGEITVPDLIARLPGAAAALAAMQKKGWVRISSLVEHRRPYKALEISSVENTPTADQQAVIAQVSEAIDRQSGAFLLKGVTGSGKTEVYMRCISHCILRKKSAIVLVPEISLTPQATERFRARFGDAVAVLHSRLSKGERFDEWLRIRTGRISVVVGARSAVFAPLNNLGLIVMDEEHENSYRSDRTPRYGTQEVAQKRCEASGAALLLGSATPSIESYFAARQGKYRLLTLKSRVNERPLPEVEVVDMRRELEQGNRTIFSAPLYREMRKCYLQNKQMILFINRRGYSTFVSCRGCGYVLRCESCDVSMTYHKTDESVRCHYCGDARKTPTVCPQCGKPYLKYFGVGTQQVEEQVKKFFPTIQTLRMDFDTTQTKDAHLHILNAFAQKKAQVLIGTQMIAKGLDFPEVTLVGVVAADSTLHVPDFRSAERAFQLITQVAGRAGRKDDPGRVVVQCYTPEHPSIACASRHDYESFYAYEIKCREQSGFPPFADFIRFLFTNKDDEAIRIECRRLRDELESLLQGEMRRMGISAGTLMAITDSPAPLHLLRGEYRHQLFIKIRRDEHSGALFELIQSYIRAKAPICSVEINPQNML